MYLRKRWWRRLTYMLCNSKKDYMCEKTMVAKVDMIIESLFGYVPSKTMVAKVDIHDIQLKKEYMCVRK